MVSLAEYLVNLDIFLDNITCGGGGKYVACRKTIRFVWEVTVISLNLLNIVMMTLFLQIKFIQV